MRCGLSVVECCTYWVPRVCVNKCECIQVGALATQLPGDRPLCFVAKIRVFVCNGVDQLFSNQNPNHGQMNCKKKLRVIQTIMLISYRIDMSLSPVRNDGDRANSATLSHAIKAINRKTFQPFSSISLNLQPSHSHSSSFGFVLFLRCLLWLSWMCVAAFYGNYFTYFQCSTMQPWIFISQWFLRCSFFFVAFRFISLYFNWPDNE